MKNLDEIILLSFFLLAKNPSSEDFIEITLKNGSKYAIEFTIFEGTITAWLYNPWNPKRDIDHADNLVICQLYEVNFNEKI